MRGQPVSKRRHVQLAVGWRHGHLLLLLSHRLHRRHLRSQGNHHQHHNHHLYHHHHNTINDDRGLSGKLLRVGLQRLLRAGGRLHGSLRLRRAEWPTAVPQRVAGRELHHRVLPGPGLPVPERRPVLRRHLLLSPRICGTLVRNGGVTVRRGHLFEPRNLLRRRLWVSLRLQGRVHGRAVRDGLRVAGLPRGLLRAAVRRVLQGPGQLRGGSVHVRPVHRKESVPLRMAGGAVRPA